MAAVETGSADAALILISNEESDRRFLDEVARSANLTVRVFATPAQARAELDGVGEANLFVDVSKEGSLNEFEACFSSLLGEGLGRISSERLHFIGPDRLSTAETGGREEVFFGNLIPRRFGSIEESGRHYGKILGNLRRGDSLGFPHLKSIELRHSTQKATILVEAEEFLRQKTKIIERSVPMILTALDEIIMNAIYDAPVNPSGEQTLKHVTRDTPVEIPAGQRITVHFGYDGEYAAFSVVDSFGSLNKYDLLKHLMCDRESDSLMIDPAGAGAGIGLATTFLKGGSLHFLCEPGIRTEVTVLFRQTKNFREFREQFRFFSVHYARKRG